MNKKLSIKSVAVVIVLTLLSIASIRLNGKPEVYMGLVFAYVGIIFIGLFSNRYISSISGAVIIGLGYLARLNFPVQVKIKKAEKLAAFMKLNESYNQNLQKYIFVLIIGAIVLGFIFGILGEKLRNTERKKISVSEITYMSVFVALSVIINTMRVGSVSFGGFPIIMSGYILGPVYGFMVGGVADIVAFIVRPSGLSFNPLFVMTSALTGLIPVLVTRLLSKKNEGLNLIKVFIGIFAGQIITSVILVPIFLVVLYGKNTIWFFVSKALANQVISIPIYAFLITVVSDRVMKVIDIKKHINK